MSIPEIDKSKLVLIKSEDAVISDVALQTREIGYYQDAWNRFKRNRASVVAFIIICLIFFFVFFGPMMKVYSPPANLADARKVGNLPPKIPGLEHLGIFDGTRKISAGKNFLTTMAKSEYGKDIIISGMPDVLLDDDPSNDFEYDSVYNLTVKVDAYRYANYISSYLDTNNSSDSVKRLMSKAEFEDALARNLVIDILSVTPDGNPKTFRINLFNYITF